MLPSVAWGRFLSLVDGGHRCRFLARFAGFGFGFATHLRGLEIETTSRSGGRKAHAGRSGGGVRYRRITRRLLVVAVGSRMIRIVLHGIGSRGNPSAEGQGRSRSMPCHPDWARACGISHPYGDAVGGLSWTS